jgi:hypothetical protein
MELILQCMTLGNQIPMQNRRSFRSLTRLAAVILSIAVQLYGQHALPPGVSEVRPPLKKPYATTPLLPEYKNEPAIYITNPKEREIYRLRFGSDGLIYDAAGHRFDTTNAVRIDEHGVKAYLKFAMFVMDAKGDFYASNFQEVRVFHHSSLVAGGEVAAAGELQVIDGKLEFVNDRSGHYRGTPEFTEQALERLGRLLPPGTIESLREKNKILVGEFYRKRSQ